MLPTTDFPRTLDPFSQKQPIKAKKIKKQQGSSRYLAATNKDLEPLPPIKGQFDFQDKALNDFEIKNSKFFQMHQSKTNKNCLSKSLSNAVFYSILWTPCSI
jgi:hypothetical protein